MFTFGWDLATFSFLVSAFAPALVVLFALWFDQWRRRSRRSKKTKPLQERLLRPPGYSLSLRLEELTDDLFNKIIGSIVLCGLTGTEAAVATQYVSESFPLIPTILLFMLAAATALPGAVYAVSAYRTMREAHIVRIGLRGEQATAEALAEASDAGFRTFHDIPAGEDWNIDHVAVGPKGVFLLETKAQRRKGANPNGDQEEHEVKFDGHTLAFPFGPDRDTVSQARRNAKWLSDYLVRKVGHLIPVDTIVVLPGWSVDGRQGPVKAMNCSYLTKYLRGQNNKLQPEDVSLIAEALEEKNRTLEIY
jgi:hypothetical protein